jgi:carbon monoxide dehydrogenase subunit G
MTKLSYRMYLRPILATAILLAAFQSHAQTDSSEGDGLSVVVKKHAGAVLVDVSMYVNATAQETWSVLTDYNHMANFFPNLHSSRIINKSGNTVRIEQTGRVAYGPFSFPFESIREIELKPFSEIRSRAIGGSLSKGDASTRLIAEGGGTKILYHSESIPNVWVPPAIGPHIIAKQTGAQFESLRNEILKRKKAQRP